MGQFGPLPQQNLHLINGKNPPATAEKPAPYTPKEPMWRQFFGKNRQLAADARSEWRGTVVNLIERKKVTRADVTALIDMCICYARVLECERSLSDNGLVVDGVSGPVKNPASTILNQYRGQLQRYRQEFGLSPVTRIRLGETEEAPPDDDSDLDDPSG